MTLQSATCAGKARDVGIGVQPGKRERSEAFLELQFFDS